MRRAAILILVLSAPQVAVAEITDSATNGFTTVNSLVVEADRMTAWAAAVEVGRWWSPAHTMSGDAARLSIEPRVQGCFCEMLGEEAGVVHLTVTFVNPNVILRLTGGLGPLGLMGVNGNMTWEFNDADDGTTVVLNYAVGGYLDGGLDAIAPAVDGVLAEAMARLKLFVETGSPEPGS